MFGAIAGGWLAQHFGWRIAFVVVGLPGLILALIVRLVVKEPVRGGADAPDLPAVDLAAPVAFRRVSRHELGELGAWTKTLFGRWPVLNMVLGVTISSFGSYGSGAFLPPYLIRTFGLGLGAGRPARRADRGLFDRRRHAWREAF